MIVSLSERPDLVATVVRWLHGEWPKGRDAAAVEARLRGGLFALVALDGDNPIGAVSVVHWTQGVAAGRPHWIDAVYVVPAHRGTGVGARLVAAAEREARLRGLQCLFALTEVPALYRGWTMDTDAPVDSPNDRVMKKIL